MSYSISGVSGSTSVSSIGFDSTTVQQITATTQSAQQDTVEVSLAAQARTLKSQGQTVKQIAANMGLTETAVNQLLGLSEDTQAAMTAAATAQVAAKSSSQPSSAHTTEATDQASSTAKAPIGVFAAV